MAYASARAGDRRRGATPSRTIILAALAIGGAAGLFSRWVDSVHPLLSLLGLMPPLVVIVVAVRELVRPPGTAELQVDETVRAFVAPPRTGRALALVAVYWRRVPLVTVTAEGVTTGAPPAVVVPWEGLGPSAPASAGYRSLRLPVVRPELIRSRRRGRNQINLPVRELTVAPALPAAVIAYHTAHPEHWAAVGTREEYARLRHALAGDRLPGQV
ncbi:hypothetical protein ACL02O_13695 [Micromonospora sp. MS34]|uniref:hypothetical protein n=1 Tax=Micromonospora sp. MS34 TaxID=3385971 RepID=UPI0039A13D7D